MSYVSPFSDFQTLIATTAFGYAEILLMGFTLEPFRLQRLIVALLVASPIPITAEVSAYNIIWSLALRFLKVIFD